LTVTGTGVITKYITITKQPKSNIRKEVEAEMSKKFGLDLENYVVDFKILSEKDSLNGQQCELFVVAVPTLQVEEYIKVAELLDMNIEAADIPANCVTKFLFGSEEGTKNNKNKNVSNDNLFPKEFAVIDIGANTMKLYIFRNKKLRANNTFYNGSNDIDKLISTHKSINNLEDAEKYKMSMYIDNHMEDLDIHNELNDINNLILTSFLPDIVKNIKLLFKDYMADNKSSNISRVYICGGGSKLKGIDTYFSSVLGIKAEYLVQSYFDIQCLKQELFSELSKNFNMFVNCIGGLVRG